MQALLNKSTCVTGTRPVTTGKRCAAVSVFPVDKLRSRRSVSHIAAQQDDKQDKGNVGLYAPEPKSVSESKNTNGANNGDGANLEAGVALEKAIGQLPPEQQKQLGRLYMLLTQHPEARLELSSFDDVRKALDNYQVLLWRPAELLNGRLAMIGFTAALANEAVTGASLWQQLYFAPYAYLSAYLLVVAAAQLNKAFGSPNKGIGPFTRFAEIVNGRAAMVGYVSLAYVEYNQELRKAATLLYSQLQQQGSGAIGL
ncbi:hypothetical protein ABBQ38_005832 [Trebouxia sp. C0009 RCD-2024]